MVKLAAPPPYSLFSVLVKRLLFCLVFSFFPFFLSTLSVDSSPLCGLDAFHLYCVSVFPITPAYLRRRMEYLSTGSISY